MCYVHVLSLPFAHLHGLSAHMRFRLMASARHGSAKFMLTFVPDVSEDELIARALIKFIMSCNSSLHHQLFPLLHHPHHHQISTLT